MEPGLVQEGDVGPAAERLPDDAGELVTDPPRHLLVVPLPGLPPRLLAGPPEAASEDLPDMLGVVGDAELPLDQAGNPGGSPQHVVPPESLRPLLQQALQLPKVGVGQPGAGAG